MFQIGDTAWAIINHFDRPKKVEIINVYAAINNSSGIIKEYGVQYKQREFTVRNVDIYPTQIDADIYWAICIQQDYDQTLQHPDFYLTDDYERANLIATKILSEYADTVPHILLKYL